MRILPLTPALLALASLPARADCPSTPISVQEAAERSSAAFVRLDAFAFADSRRIALSDLSCLSQPIAPQVAALIHQMNALASFQVRDPDAAVASFRAMLEAVPGWPISPDLVPPGGPVSQLLLQARSSPSGARAPLTLPSGVAVQVDGTPASALPTDRPYVLVVLRAPGFSGAGDVLWSGLVQRGEPLPVSLERFQMGEAWAGHAEPTGDPPHDKAPPPAPPPPAPKPPWLELRAGYSAGSLNLELDPTSSGGSPVALDGALTQGADLDLRVWLPRAPALGMLASGDLAGYAVTATPTYGGEILTDRASLLEARALVLGRLRRERAGLTPSLTLGAGWSWSRAEAYGVDDDEVRLASLSGHRLALLGELGLRYHPVELNLSFIEDLAPGSPRSEATAGVDVALSPRLSLGLHLGRAWQSGTAIYAATGSAPASVAGPLDWGLNRVGLDLGLRM